MRFTSYFRHYKHYHCLEKFLEQFFLSNFTNESKNGVKSKIRRNQENSMKYNNDLQIELD